MGNRKKIGVLLSGSGVYDGSEIHEAVLTLLAIDQMGHEAVCMAPNIDQHHVVNHLTGEEMNEKRNVLTESARIARGEVADLAKRSAADFDVLVVPGGFGAAKNLTKWAFAGNKGEIHADVKRIILETHAARKPIAAMCMGPTVVAKALEEKGLNERLTVGTVDAPSPYDIRDIGSKMNAIGADTQMADVLDIVVDPVNKLVSSPCYMMTTTIAMVNEGIQRVMRKAVEMA